MEKNNNNNEKFTGWDPVAIIIAAVYLVTVACVYIGLMIKTGHISF